MRYFVVFLFLLFTPIVIAQDNIGTQKINGTIVDENTLLPLGNVQVINLNLVNGTTTNNFGYFELNARINDTLHITYLGFKSLKIRVTNDWVKSKSTKIKLTEKAFVLDEVVVSRYNLTGVLEVDSKLIPTRENFRYSISGLSTGYEAGEYSPNAVNRVIGSILNPVDLLYNMFGKKSNELKKLREMKKDDTVRNLLNSKFDRETLAVLLGVEIKDINDILERCNYSEAFIKTANDLQIMDAISACYEEYKILKKK